MKHMKGTGAEKLELDLVQRIDALCEQFETAWRRAERPRLEDYLHALPGAAQAELFAELLRLEIELRFDQGQQAPPADLQERFPQDQARINAVWREIAETFSPPPIPAATEPR